MNKVGDIRMIFGNPVKCEHLIDKAKLIKKISDSGVCEQWVIEYLNEEGHEYVALIKKQNEVK